MSTRLGELLVKRGLITTAQLDKAIEHADGQENGALSTTLVELRIFSDAELTAFLQKEYRLPLVDPAAMEVPPEVVRLVPSNLSRRHHLVAISLTGSTLTLAMSDPSNLVAINEVKFLTGYDVKVAVAATSSVTLAINRLYDEGADYNDVLAQVENDDVELVKAEDDVDVKELGRATEDAPVVRLVNAMLTSAIKRRASDIHLEPFEKMFRVRYRVDGVLEEIMKPPLKLKNAITSRIKVMAQLDIAERRLPQDGRIKLKFGPGQDMDFRVSVLPTIFGEKIVLRLLDKSNLQLDMTKLGFEELALKDFKDSIYKPFGMVLVTGPTGSGKTTTLYSALSELNKITQNISTAEDPVEYNLVGINQVQINEDIGLNFANALRSFLRQDPDIIMVGEIRDFETAEIAIKAALTGHLVLSTLHTNDAPSTINRLLNMGVEPFLVASSVNLVLAQRLARLICSACREPVEIHPQALIELGVGREEAAGSTCFRGAGCPQCGGTGYRGRVALYEVMPVSEELRELVLNGASATDIKKTAISIGMMTLRQSGLLKLRQGLTTIEEVIRVTMAD
ncbi:MAG TPA: type IV-A pilus assembly ATPase PilB [Candidatus Dormibacteraeota bacterium]|nr:type IV-A pilus assembly ATPase PilB [Candidatus Dormibacteraeota bacterium]